MIKSTILALSSLAALALAAVASAAGPTLSVAATSSSYSAAASTIIRFADDGSDPTASIDVYAPPGYAADLNQPFGSTIGRIDAHATTATTPDVRLAGPIKNGDPLAYVDAAATCTPDRTVHDAVWTTTLNAAGAPLGHLTVFVDRAPSSDAADYSVRLRACFDDPAMTGLRLTRATLTLNAVFTNPGTAGEYRWTTILRTLATVPALPLESQTIVRLPPRLTLARKLIRPNGSHGRTFIRLSGAVTEQGRGVTGVRAEVLGGQRASALRRLTYATSFEGGQFAVVAPLRSNTVFKARISAPLRAGPLSRCELFKLQPDAICSSLTLAPFTAESPSVTLPRR
ncbi:MAG: hypothetical protein H0W87_06675 [Actinobacteria bacterium]|nr:hypothetical protein [Actinomycetota bacterium]